MESRKTEKKGRVRETDGSQIFWSEIPEEVSSDKRLTPSSKLVWGHIRRRQGYNPNANPSHEDIASNCGLSISQVKRDIRLLVEVGWLQVKSRAGRYGENLYSVPPSSDSRNEKTYATKTMLLGIKEQTEEGGIGQNDLCLNELRDRSKRTHGGVKMNRGIGQNDLLKDIRYKDNTKDTKGDEVSIEEVFSVVTEENPQSGDRQTARSSPDFVRWFAKQYQDKTGQVYSISWAKEAGIIKPLLDTLGWEETAKRAEVFFNSTQKAYTIAYFKACINSLQGAVGQPTPQSDRLYKVYQNEDEWVFKVLSTEEEFKLNEVRLPFEKDRIVDTAWDALVQRIDETPEIREARLHKCSVEKLEGYMRDCEYILAKIQYQVDKNIYQDSDAKEVFEVWVTFKKDVEQLMGLKAKA